MLYAVPSHMSCFSYAANFVSNFQGSDPKYLQASSCCKHYFAYDLENWEGEEFVFSLL